MKKTKKKLSERPLASNEIRKQPFLYHVNRVRGQIDDIIHRDGLQYKALCSEDSFLELVNSQKSYIRFGDAEAKLMLGGNWPTQMGSKVLRNELIRIIEDYSQDSAYLVGLANSRICMEKATLQQIGRYKIWRNSRFLYRRLLKNKKEIIFLEANMFRVGPDELKLTQIETIWKSLKQVIIIHNNTRSLNWFRKQYPDIESYYIKIPDKNMFSELDDIQNTTLNLIARKKLDRQSCAILIAAGAGGNVLNYNLCHRHANYTCYDMGNFFHMQINRDHVLSVLASRKKNCAGY